MYKSIFSSILLLLPCISFAATVTPTKIHDLPSKASPVAADELMIEDSANSWKSRRINLGSAPISTATQTALDLKADESCFVDATAFNACFALDWPTGFDVTGNYTVTKILTTQLRSSPIPAAPPFIIS